MTLREILKEDFSRFTQTYRLRNLPYNKWKIFFESIFFKAGFQAVILHRLSHACFEKHWIYPAWFLMRFNQWFTGAEIEFNAKIGPGLFIAHPHGIVIGRGTVIGEQATIFQGVSFGVKSWHPDEIQKFPKVGCHCFFFAQSVITGDIAIGDYCVIGASALVNQDMPSGSLARGVPAQIIPGVGREMILIWENAS